MSFSELCGERVDGVVDNSPWVAAWDEVLLALSAVDQNALWNSLWLNINVSVQDFVGHTVWRAVSARECINEFR